MSAELNHLFNVLHGHFDFESDQQQFGKPEHWQSPNEIKAQLKDHGYLIGDCDDFASLAVGLLRTNGHPARFVLCTVETGELHLVAECEGWIICNRQSSVMRQDDLDYKWLSISGFKAGDAWYEIEDAE